MELIKRLFARRHLSGPQPVTDRDKAVALARMVVQKQKLGISLTPSQSLLMSREFLLAVKHDPVRYDNRAA